MFTALAALIANFGSKRSGDSCWPHESRAATKAKDASSARDATTITSKVFESHDAELRGGVIGTSLLALKNLRSAPIRALDDFRDNYLLSISSTQ